MYPLVGEKIRETYYDIGFINDPLYYVHNPEQRFLEAIVKNINKDERNKDERYVHLLEIKLFHDFMEYKDFLYWMKRKDPFLKILNLYPIFIPKRY